MAQNFKYERLAQDIQNKINEVINNQIDELDFVSVTEVELTKDLQDAKVYVTSLMDGQEDYILKTLTKKEGLIKKVIAKSIQMRKIPKLIFKYDNSLANYNKIDRLLNDEK
ncbi:MAG: 30S ribosome-binding factor RbfA [Mycoplasmatales bacterium]